MELARRFAQAIHAKYPGKLLAYNCSPSFNWQKNLDDKTIASFQQQLSDMGYKFQFITRQVSTACGSTCLTRQTPMPGARV
ncbi:hypothetical protein DMI65_02990 [Escherichia coli]|nr:hypothetical protein [Escherichia coli]